MITIFISAAGILLIIIRARWILTHSQHPRYYAPNEANDHQYQAEHMGYYDS